MKPKRPAQATNGGALKLYCSLSTANFATVMKARPKENTIKKHWRMYMNEIGELFEAKRGAKFESG